MNIARIIAAASAGGAALGLILAPVPSASAGAATVPAGAKAAQAVTTAKTVQAVKPVVTEACGTGSATYTRPSNYGLSCDSSDLLVHLRWAHWGLKGAGGHGLEALNDCTPDCARGKYHVYPVRISFWGLAPVTGKPGEVRYTHYTLTYTKTVPAGLSRKRTGTL